MNTIRRAVRLAVFSTLVALVACTSDSTDAQIQAIVNSVVLDLGLGKLTVGQTLKAQAILHDVAGSAVSGTPVSWSSSNTDVATVGQDGTITALTAGQSDISASAGGHSAKATLTVVADGGPGLPPVVATKVVIVAQPSAVMNGVVILPAPAVELRDASDNRVAGADQLVTATIGSGTGTISGNTAMSVDGVATFPDLRIAGVGSFTITFSAVGLTSATSVAFNVTDVLATQLAIATQPSPSSANGQALGRQPAVQLLDASGSAVARSGVTVTVSTDTDATIGGTTTATTDASGIATFTNLSISGKKGPKGLKFTSPGLTPTTSDPVVVVPGPASAMVIVTQPSSASQTGVAFAQQPAVQLQDASSNDVAQAGVVVTASIASGTGTIAGTTSATTDANGRATFTNLAINGVGTSTLQLASSGLPSATSTSIGVTAGSPSQLSITTQPSASVQSGAAFAQQPAVQLRDAAGNAVSQSGVVVSASILTGGGTLGGTSTATTGANGVATFTNLSITGTAGARTLSFGATGFTNVTSSSITVSASAASQLAITTQPAATAQVGVALTRQPVVQLRDASGNNVTQSGVAVTAAVSVGTLSGTATATTNASGVATFTNLALLGAPGSPTLTFSATGLASATSSSISLTVGAVSQVAITTQPGTAVNSGVALSPQPAVKVTDVSGNAVSGASVTAAISTGTGTLGGTATATTNSSGVATFTNLSITGSGAFTLKFTSSSIVSANSNSITVTQPATKLAVSTQPPTSVNSGATFATAVRLQNAAGTNVSQAGVSVTVSIASGSGVLAGTKTVNTGSTGIATFSTLNITGSGAHTLTFVATGLTAATSNAITVNAPLPAASISITTQPSSFAASGAVFGTQPVVQLRDASGGAVSQSGVVVTAAIATGGGTLGGTATATTNASGVASFTALSITGTDGPRTLSFSATGLTSATSSAVTLGAVPLYPNRPAAFTNSTEIDFSQAVPSLPDNVDRPITGATGWNMIYFDTNWSKTSDATAPQSGPSVWTGHWAPGAYGGGVIGQGGGHGIGNVFTYAPSGTNRLYLSLRVYFDFDASLWHPISNKFVNLEGDHSQILMQLREGGNWRHAEELGASGFSSFWVDPGNNMPGQVDNRAVPNRQWTQIELLIDIPNHVYKIWQDGVLTTNASPTFASTVINTVGIYAFRGGGGETLSTDLYYKYDHFFVAW